MVFLIYMVHCYLPVDNTEKNLQPPNTVKLAINLLHVSVALIVLRWMITTLLLLISFTQLDSRMLLMGLGTDFLQTTGLLIFCMLTTFRIADGRGGYRIAYVLFLFVIAAAQMATIYEIIILFAGRPQIYFYWMAPSLFVIRIALQSIAFIFLFQKRASRWFAERKKVNFS